MTPISLIPPVDYCPSCEGRRAEAQAEDIGAARARQAELKSEDAAPAVAPPGASPTDAAGGSGETAARKPVDGAVQPLLAGDLVVQASVAASEIGAAGGEDAALRLRGAQAYGAT